MILFKCTRLSTRHVQTLVNTSVKSITLNEKSPLSFQKWILNYFQKTDNYITYKSESPLNKDKDSELIKPKDVKLLGYTISLDNIMYHKEKLYKDWDKELYCRIQNNPQLTDILKLMDFWLNTASYKCTYLQSYAFAVTSINDIVKHKEISRQNLIQCMHYVSLLKKTTETQNIFNIVLSKLHRQPLLLKEFTLEEMCIFCNSLFTTSTKINSKVILKNIVKVLNDNLDKILLSQNEQMLSSLVKPLRLSKYYDYNVLENMAKKTTATKMNHLEGIVHLLALYSDALYSNFTQIAQFGYNFLQCFKKLEVDDVRIKDVDRFLWAFSNLGCESCKNEIKDTLVPYFFKTTLNLMKTPAYFVNSLLWLQMLQCSSEELVKTILTPINLNRILRTGQLRDAARFSLLLSCLNIENKELLSEELLNFQQNTLEPEMGMHLAMRKHLANIYRAVMCLQTTLGIESVKVGYQIPCLYIAGITIETNRSVSEIEVLEESVCLHNSEIPHGLMKLKLRLMKKIGSKVILIDKKSSELDTEELFIHIEDTIKKQTYMYREPSAGPK